jgi:hypothetical protein
VHDTSWFPTINPHIPTRTESTLLLNRWLFGDSALRRLKRGAGKFLATRATEQHTTLLYWPHGAGTPLANFPTLPDLPMLYPHISARLGLVCGGVCNRPNYRPVAGKVKTHNGSRSVPPRGMQPL